MEPLRPSADILRRTALFESLSDADAQAILVCLRGRRYRTGELVLREGDPGGFLVLLSEGTFAASVRGPGGQVRELGRMGAGELAGELSFLDPAPRSATVTALSDGVGWELGADAMDVLRKNAPSAARVLVAAALRSVTGRLRRLDERLEKELGR